MLFPSRLEERFRNYRVFRLLLYYLFICCVEKKIPSINIFCVNTTYSWMTSQSKWKRTTCIGLRNRKIRSDQGPQSSEPHVLLCSSLLAIKVLLLLQDLTWMYKWLIFIVHIDWNKNLSVQEFNVISLPTLLACRYTWSTGGFCFL